MAPRREPFQTKNGRSYTLWADINDVMSAIMPAYWADSRDRRKERGWMFRGQRNSEWDLVPSLYRPPFDDTILKARQDYTDAFLDALQKESGPLGIARLSHSEYLAIAQHYGFYTPLLDFTWNAEAAAYFATLGGQPGQAGVIFAFSLTDYQGMRNPFAALGSTVEDSDAAFKNAGMVPLPDLELVELYNIPRIYEQEGLFIRVTPENIESLLHECIDRFYFRQRANRIYTGNFAHRAHALPSRRLFASDAAYEAFLDIARKEEPGLFGRTDTFGTVALFPPADPISKFAERWKRDHPDPATGARAQPSRKSCQLGLKSGKGAVMNSFSGQMGSYYYGDYPKSPYQSQYLSKGRKLVELLCDYSELDDPEVQRWLLWELFKRNLPGGLKCTLKLGNAKSWGSDDEGFRFIVVDRWLADSYQHTLGSEQLQTTFCQITFGALSARGRPEVSVREIAPFTPPRSVEKAVPINPHQGVHATNVLNAIESRLVGLEEGVVGSFLYDLHHIVMLSMGRNLELTVALVESAPCLQRSPLVRDEHVDGPALLVRVTDHFTGGVTHTAVCKNHWDHTSEGDVDVMHPAPWTLLGLA